MIVFDPFESSIACRYGVVPTHWEELRLEDLDKLPHGDDVVGGAHPVLCRQAAPAVRQRV